MRPFPSFLVLAVLSAATAHGCGALSTRPRTPPTRMPDDALPATIQRETPPHYRHIPQGTYEGAGDQEPSGEIAAGVDSARTSSGSAFLEPPPFGAPSVHEASKSVDENHEEDGGD